MPSSSSTTSSGTEHELNDSELELVGDHAEFLVLIDTTKNSSTSSSSSDQNKPNK